MREAGAGADVQQGLKQQIGPELAVTTEGGARDRAGWGEG